METIDTSKESATAGKAGESTAKGTPAADADKKNLTAAHMSSLLSSEFAEVDANNGQPAPAAAKGVQTEAGKSGGDKTPVTEPAWTPEQQAWFTKRAAAKTDEEIATVDGEAPEFTAEQQVFLEAQSQDGGSPDGQTATALPAELQTQLTAWETAGGALPPSLQTIVDKRIGREVGKVKDLEARATKAESEVTRLTTELQTRGTGAAPSGVMDEAALNKLVTTGKTFVNEARAFVGGYATDEQKARMERHMQSHGWDENELKQEIDKTNDWLRDEIPVERQRLQVFKAEFQKAEPLVKQHFPFLDDPAAPEYKLANEMTAMFPELKTRTPVWRAAQGIWVLGMKAFEELKAKANGGEATPKQKFFLPGKAPKKTPLGGSPAAAPRVDSAKAAQAAQASEDLKQAPTASNVTKALKIALQ